MYLPKPIYEYAPYYWVVAGILVALLGFSADPGLFRYFSITLGALSVAWGMMIFQRRRARAQLNDSEA